MPPYFWNKEPKRGNSDARFFILCFIDVLVPPEKCSSFSPAHSEVVSDTPGPHLVSHGHILGEENPELYKLIWKNLVIVDEYPVENTHCIIRSKTNDHDSAEKMQETAKATFQSRQALSNFRKYLQLRIIPCFHKSTLTIWIYVVLNCLQSVYQHNKISQQCLIRKKKNFNSAKCLWQLEVIYLEYASQNQPNSNKRCVIPSCLVSSERNGGFSKDVPIPST